MKIHVRELLEYNEDELWSIKPDTEIELTFDDGVTKKVGASATILSAYHWRLSKFYVEIPINSDLHIGDQDFTDDVSRAMMESVIKSTRKLDLNKEDVWFLIKREIYNRLFNAIATRLQGYISQTGAEDVLEILDDARLRELNDKITDVESLDDAYEELRVIFKTERYPSNPISRGVKITTVKMNQMLPSFSGKGKGTDIDSEIYGNIARRGFAMGFNTLADFAKESRSAAKSHLFNKDRVAIAEYFNRKLQLVITYFLRLVKGDCGTRDYHVFHIPDSPEGIKLLNSMDGLHQVFDDGSTKPIDPNDKYLLGKDIKFRTTACCKYAHDQEICEVCYGDISYSIPEGDNPGHVSCTSINEKITQIIISTKHLDFIIHNFIARLRRGEEAFFSVNPKHPDTIYLNKTRQGEKLYLKVSKKQAMNLTSVNYAADINILTPNKITEISDFELCKLDEDNVIYDKVGFDGVRKATPASFSTSLLKYIKSKGWMDAGKDYLIDLSEWNVKHPLLIYPNKHESMAEFGNRVEKFIRSAKETKTSKDSMLVNYNRMEHGAVDAALLDAYNLISSKIGSTYLGHVATILAASRVTDVENGDYSVPHSMHQGKFETHDSIIFGRSIGISSLYQDLPRVYNNVESFINHDRPYGILDDMIYIPDNKYHKS